MDRFFVSYNFEDEIFLHSPIPNPVIKQAIPRRAASMKQDVSHYFVTFFIEKKKLTFYCMIRKLKD